jgi:hypothetical protein
MSVINAIKRSSRHIVFVVTLFATISVAQACGQQQCSDGEVPCNAGVDASGAVCWTCCPA